MDSYLESDFDLGDARLVSVIDELPLWSAPFGLRLFEIVRMRRGITALDLGCGTGFPLFELAGRLGPSSTVIGVDPWEAARDRVKLKIEQYGAENVSVIDAVGEDLPFEDGYFDLIVSNNGLNNVKDQARTLSECRRISKRGAQMVLTMNLDSTMMEFYDVFGEVLAKEGRSGEIEAMREHIHSKRRPVDETRTLLESAGFAINGAVEDSFAFRFADGSAMLRHFLIRLAFIGPWKEIVRPGDRERVFGRVEKILNAVAENSGGIRLSVPFITFDCERL